MVKANYVFATLAPFTLDANQFARIDVVEVLRRISARVAATGDRRDQSLVPIHLSKQNPAAFVRITFLAVLA
jgi:hypothetical protein